MGLWVVDFISAKICSVYSSYLRSYTNFGPKIRSSHDYKFLNVNATEEILYLFLFPRTIRMWNKLPQDIIESGHERLRFQCILLTN